MNRGQLPSSKRPTKPELKEKLRSL